MSLQPRPTPPVPDDTARVARSTFPKGNPYLRLRDELGTVFGDRDFADLYPRRGEPALAPWRLALVTTLQFREGLSDRPADDALRARSDRIEDVLARGVGEPRRRFTRVHVQQSDLGAHDYRLACIRHCALNAAPKILRIQNTAQKGNCRQ